MLSCVRSTITIHFLKYHLVQRKKKYYYDLPYQTNKLLLSFCQQ
ncbi:unnamed protein product, partial [Rotaria sp. Silwood2]